MPRPYTFPPRTDGQVPHDTWWQALQDAVADIDANGPNAVASATLGSGTPDANTVLYGDRVWRNPPSGGGGGSQTGLVVAAANAPAAVRASTPYVCDGTADQVDINAAIASLPANNGSASSYSGTNTGAGEIVLVGTFFLTAPITANLDHVTIRGVGGSTRLRVASGFVGNYVLSVNRDAQSRPCYNVVLADFVIDGNARVLNASSGAILGLDAMLVQGRVRNVWLHEVSGDGIKLRGAASGWQGNSNIIEDCLVYKCGGNGLWSTDLAADNEMHNCMFRENLGHGCWINTASWKISDLFNWGNQGRGLLISGGAARIQLDNIKLEQNSGGLYIGLAGAGNHPSEIAISNSQFGSNGWSSMIAQPGTTFDDVQIAGSGGAPTGIYFDNCLWDGPYSQAARYGLNTINGDRLRVRGGRIFPAASYSSGQVNTNGLSASSALQFRDVYGYNYLGPVAVTATGSPMTITAGFTPEVIYLAGGTVSSVTKGGLQVAAGTNTQTALEPGESIVVTYSSAPTITRDRK